MPQLQTVNLNPKREESPLEKLIGGYTKARGERETAEQESDALGKLYEQYKQDGNNIENLLMGISKDPKLGPTTKVNTIKQFTEFQKHNNALQKQVREEHEKALKKENNKKITADIAKQRNIPEEQAAGYEENPGLFERVTRPPNEGKKTQASQPIDPDQLNRIQGVESSDKWQDASIPEKGKLLRDAGVSKENADSVLSGWIEQNKLDNERPKILTAKQAEADAKFANDQISAIPQLLSEQRHLENAWAKNEEGVTGGVLDALLERAGLVQWTSEGYREFHSIAKDAVKNVNIKESVGSQISAMEFGFFVNSTISPNFSKEANARILKKEMLANRYKKLYADITNNIIEQNGGIPPERLQAKVNEEFSKQSKGISNELKEVAAEFDAIQNVPPGYILMYDKKRRPLHVPANEEEKYSKPPFNASRT